MPAPTLPSENQAATAVNPSRYAIEFDKVSIAFDEKVVLQDISFQLAHGETKAVFGVGQEHSAQTCDGIAAAR
jgi:ABC-type multidrug transport system fused ATPase/permease subunit